MMCKHFEDGEPCENCNEEPCVCLTFIDEEEDEGLDCDSDSDNENYECYVCGAGLEQFCVCPK